MWGIRVIVPHSLQSQLLQSLHQNHPGVSRMKAIARSYFWWKGLDKNIEQIAKSCRSCQTHKSAPPVAPLHPWMWPELPWLRVHIDFAGPFLGKMFLICVDAHSKWPEVLMMSSTTTHATMEALRSLFARYGLPEQIVSDNGPQFTSAEFATFMKGNGIKHIMCAPYHPSSNGLAERFVQTFKRAMKAGEKEGKTLAHRLSEFIFEYRATPHGTTNTAPCQLFLNRHIRSRFDLLKPSTRKAVLAKQQDQKAHHDVHARPHFFTPNDSVMVRDFRHNKDKWIYGTILKSLGPLTYLVRLEDGTEIRRHVDHINPHSEDLDDSSTPQAISEDSSTIDDAGYPAIVEDSTILEQQSRYPSRERRPPDRLMNLPN